MKKEEKQRLFDALEKRSSLNVSRRVLAQNGFPRGIGWAQIRDKLKDSTVEAKADYGGLRNGLRSLLTASNKTVRVYKIDKADRATFEKKFADLKIDHTGEFAKAFPYPVPDNVLASMALQPTNVVSKSDMLQARGLLLSSVHIINVREELTAGQIGATASKYDEVFGIRTIKFQTFDTVLLSKNNPYIYVLTDSHTNHTVESLRALQSSTKDKINKILGKNALKKPENLFPTIETIYNSKEGVVRRLHYTTTTGAGKQEWMRGHASCLREELAHKAGMTALSGKYSGYALDVEWELSEVEGYLPTPSLGLHGAYRITYDPKPKVTEAIVRGCANQSELQFVLQKLMEHLAGVSKI